MVETGGLENRFALTGNGGSNPSPSAIDLSQRSASGGSNPSPSAIDLSQRSASGGSNPSPSLNCDSKSKLGIAGLRPVCPRSPVPVPPSPFPPPFPLQSAFIETLVLPVHLVRPFHCESNHEHIGVTKAAKGLLGRGSIRGSPRTPDSGEGKIKGPNESGILCPIRLYVSATIIPPIS